MKRENENEEKKTIPERENIKKKPVNPDATVGFIAVLHMQVGIQDI